MDTHRAPEDELGLPRLHPELLVVQLVVVRAERLAVQFERQQLQLLAMQQQRRQAGAALGLRRSFSSACTRLWSSNSSNFRWVSSIR